MRLIDAEVLKNKVIEQISSLKTRSLLDKDFITETKIVWFIKLLKIIENAPTIEAKPVVHAHWEEHREFYEDEGFEGYYYSCSNCGGTLYGDVEGFNFCHCCGAQMDEVVSDNNVGSKTEGVKIPVINMEDVPKIMEEMEK